MFGKNPREKFTEDLDQFDFSAAFGSFLKDNMLLCFIVLAASLGAVVFNGARGILSNKKVGTILLAIMVCRAYHAGSTRTIVITEKEVKDDNSTDTV